MFEWLFIMKTTHLGNHVDTYIPIITRMHAIENGVHVIANNISSSSVGGAKAQIIRLAGKIKNFGAHMKLQKQDTDFSKGHFVKTDNPYNVMINNDDGFFAVKKDDRVAYTKDGRFSIDNQRRLITPDGELVMDESGDNEILIPIDAGDIHIASDGRIFDSNEQVVGKIGVFSFEDKNRLIHIGSSSFLKGNENEEVIQVDSPNLISYGYESSNINAVKELTELSAITSQYKRLSSVLKIHETQNEQGKDKYIKVWS